MYKKHIRILLLIASFAFCYAIAGASSLFVESSMGSWYDLLKKPSWNPPRIVFPIVWNLLYAMIALSIWKILCIAKVNKARILFLFFIQMFFNFTWTFIFFYQQLPFLAFVNIVLLIFFIAWNIREFYRYSRFAAWFLVPYFFWVVYAATLNFYIWYSN